MCRGEISILLEICQQREKSREWRAQGQRREETQLLGRVEGVKTGRGTDRYSEGNTHTNTNTHTHTLIHTYTHLYTADRVEYSNSGVECWL